MAKADKSETTDDYGPAADDDQADIMEFSEDIADAEPPVPLPVGPYRASIHDASKKVSASSGKQYIQVDFFIHVDEYPADYPREDAPEGMTVPYRRVPWEDDKVSRHRIRKFCEAIGAEMGRRMGYSRWIGQEAIIHLIHDTYDGITRNQIAKVVATD